MQLIISHMNSPFEIIFNLTYAFLSIATSALFWIKDKNGGLKRVLVSAHSFTMFVILCSALLVGGYGYSNKELMPVFYFFMILPLLSIVLSFIYFKGSKWFHLAHIWNVIAFVWTFFVGSMAVTGDWL